uniref:Uncharacterized protein n=1 Tax=Podoviridae sp. cttxo15 TaxID=2826584 RepID=A0A8S5N2T0_9CAUD|nr:MAG TPA: hypothetical protein [Podoviridae sp. cttxo15]
MYSYLFIDCWSYPTARFQYRNFSFIVLFVRVLSCFIADCLFWKIFDK